MSQAEGIAQDVRDSTAPADNLVPLRRRPKKPGIFQRPWVQRTLVWGGIAVAWQLFGEWQGPFFFPTFTATVAAFPGLFSNGEVVNFLHALEDMAIGFGLAAVVGVVLGVLVGTSKWMRWTIKPYVDALFVTSFSAFLPFLIVLLGTERTYRVSVVFLFAVLYVVMSTSAGVRAVSPGLSDVARSFGASTMKYQRDVVFFSALPLTLTGLRLAMAQSIQGVIVAQLWVSIGTGSDLTGFTTQRQLDKFFALALLIAATGAALVQGMALLQKRATPWADDVSRAMKGTR